MIKILFFAKYREQFGSSKLDLASVALATVGDVIGVLKQSYGDRVSFLADHAPSQNRVLISVNQELATVRTPVKEGDEIAFFPPVTGG